MGLSPNSIPIDHHNTMSLSPPPPPPSHGHRHLGFYWSRDAQFLISGWPDDNSGMYALGIILVFSLAILVEFLGNLNLVRPGSNRAATFFFQAGLRAIRAGFGYMVIMAVMSYNGGVFIAASLGHAVGFVLFRSGLTKKE